MKLNITAFNRLHCMHHAICDESIFTRTSTDNSNKCLLLAHDDDVMWRSNTVQDLGGGVVSFCHSCHCCQAVLPCSPRLSACSCSCVIWPRRCCANTWLSLNSSCSLVARRLGLLSPRNERAAPPPPPIFVIAFFHLCDFNLLWVQAAVNLSVTEIYYFTKRACSLSCVQVAVITSVCGSPW